MSLTGAPTTETLAQRLLPRTRWFADENVRNAVLVVGGALFVALTAQIRIPLPFSPVPITGQTLGVLLVGGLLGTRLGLFSMLFYLLLGLIGLPFYTGGAGGIEVWQGATAGYLAAFPIAAALVGWLAQRGWDRRFSTMALAMVFGNVIIYTLGVGWIAFGLGAGLGSAIMLGLVPFLIGDAIKIALAGVALPGGWRLLGSGKQRD